MIKNLLVLQLFFLMMVIYAQDLDNLVFREDVFSEYSFKNKVYQERFIDEITGEAINNDYEYELSISHSIPFLNIDIDGIYQKKLCLFSDDILIIYDKKEDGKVWITKAFKPISSNRHELFDLRRNTVSSSSFLIEGKTSYPASNLGRVNLESSWVEGVEGDGIGERIFYEEGTITNLYWFNGYVSYEKPYLYTRNNRVKKIKITDELSGDNQVVELIDSPNPQKISFGERATRKITIEILEVYKGTHYQDTCVNFILFEA